METDTSLKQMGLDLGLRTDQKQIGLTLGFLCQLLIKCIPFRVYPQEICFSWKKLLSSWQRKPSVKLSKRGTTSLVSLVERAQPGVKAVFPLFASPDTLFFTKFRAFPYFDGFKQKIYLTFHHNIIQCGEQIRMNEDQYLP